MFLNLATFAVTGGKPLPRCKLVVEPGGVFVTLLNKHGSIAESNTKKVPKMKTENVYTSVARYNTIKYRALQSGVYNTDIGAANGKIEQYKQLINSDIEKCPKAALGICTIEEVVETVEENVFPDFIALKKKWRDAEYSAYFAQYLGNSLEELELGVIAKRLEEN